MYFKRLLFFLLITTAISCSSTQESDEDLSEDASAFEDTSEEADIDDLDEDLGDDFADEDFSAEDSLDEIDDEFASLDDEIEEELNEDFEGLEESFAEEDDFSLADQVDDQEQQADEFAQDEFAQNDDFGAAAAPSSASVQVTALDFKANENGGSIVISTDQPASYSTRSNQDNQQFIVELSDTNLPQKFQRPYNTNEFQGAVGLFEAYQNPGGSVARFVIQLEADSEPLVTQEGNQIIIVANSAVNESQTSDALIAEEDTAIEDFGSEQQQEFEPAVDQAAIERDSEILQSKNIEDFLTGNTNFYGRKINIEVKDWDIRDVFDFIAEQSGLNLLLDEQVKGTVSLKLRQIPWDQALVVLMQSKELGYVRQGNILRIAPLKSLSEESNTKRQVLLAQRNLQPLQVRIFPVSYAKSEEVLKQVEPFLTPNRGRVNVDPRTNTIVVTDIAETIRKVEKLIKSLDTQTPQVLIESKIIEATEDFSRQIGVNWNSSGLLSGAKKIGRSEVGNTEITALGTYSGGLTQANNNLALTIGNLDFIGDLTATLSLLETQSVVKVISSPRIVTLNNRVSKIEQITEIPILISSVVDGAVQNSIEYRPITISLEVKPQITSDGGVVMDINLKREFVGPQDENSNVTIFKRAAKTQVLINNGDTAVIGGIYNNTVTTGNEKVPWLGDIPLLGWLFKFRSKAKEKNELMMFLTPKVLNIDKAFNTSGGTNSEDLKLDESFENDFFE